MSAFIFSHDEMQKIGEALFTFAYYRDNPYFWDTWTILTLQLYLSKIGNTWLQHNCRLIMMPHSNNLMLPAPFNPVNKMIKTPIHRPFEDA